MSPIKLTGFNPATKSFAPSNTPAGRSPHSLGNPDAAIATRIAQLAQLGPDDRNAILNVLDGLIAKNRVSDAPKDAS